MAAMIPIPGNQVTICRDGETEPFASIGEQPDGTWMVTADCPVDGHVYQTSWMAVRAVLDAFGIREDGTIVDPVEMAGELESLVGVLESVSFWIEDGVELERAGKWAWDTARALEGMARRLRESAGEVTFHG